MRAEQTRRLPAVASRAARLLAPVLPLAAFASFSGYAVAQQTPASGAASHHRRSAHLLIKRRATITESGKIVVFKGRLLARIHHARVSLVARTGTRWTRVASSRTHRHGSFHLTYHVRTPGARRLRVRFAGGQDERPASAAAGSIVGVAPAIASWYYDAGHTACGFHATYGVANRTLPCGTKVTLAYHGRTVRATVDDRGPYVYGRTFDLNQTTARYLHMSGVAQILASV